MKQRKFQHKMKTINLTLIPIIEEVLFKDLKVGEIFRSTNKQEPDDLVSVKILDTPITNLAYSGGHNVSVTVNALRLEDGGERCFEPNEKVIKYKAII